MWEKTNGWDDRVCPDTRVGAVFQMPMFKLKRMLISYTIVLNLQD